MMVDSRLIGYLKRGIDHEMSAIQYYTTQSNLCKLWGLDTEALKFEEEAKEEFEHASRLTNFLLTLGLTPSGSQLKSVPKTKSIKDVLSIDWRLEKEAVDLYFEASQYCQKIGNQQAFELFSQLCKEEEHHLQSIEKWMQQLG